MKTNKRNGEYQIQTKIITKFLDHIWSSFYNALAGHQGSLYEGNPETKLPEGKTLQ